MFKKLVTVFTVAFALISLALPVSSYAYSPADLTGFLDRDGRYYIPSYTIDGCTTPEIDVTDRIPENGDVHYFILKQEQYYYTMFYSNAVAVVDPGNHKITILKVNNGYSSSCFYKADNDGNQDGVLQYTDWQYVSIPQSINYNSDDEFYYTSVDLYDSDNNLVFPLTPWAVAIRELKTVAIPRVLGEMKIAVLCGVGCLALLIGLAVLFKVFSKFRVKS